MVVTARLTNRYGALVQMAGGVCKYVTLKQDESSGAWNIDADDIEAAITPKTKLILLNTPHNPTGKVFTRNELEAIAEIIRRHPHVIPVSDEVYEFLVFDEKEHIRFASLAGMWERCITVSSAGKTFSATGWKVGWLYGAKHLIKAVVGANQHVVFCVSSPTQRALAKIIKKSMEPYEGYPTYFAYICAQYERKRNTLVEALKLADLKPCVPEGGFFIIANTSAYAVPNEYLQEPGPDGVSKVTHDWGFARYSMSGLRFPQIP